jgi:MYXO-CTERM domain-containing protein
MPRKRRMLARPSLLILSTMTGIVASDASAATNQFRGVNWADSRDNFQAGVLYISGLSSSDTYNSALAVGNAIMEQFVTKLGANSVRIPINEATVSQYWATYTGAIDAVLSKGNIVFCYWDSAKSNKPPDMNAWWAMWKTVVDKYGSNENAYFEIFNEPNMYSKTDLGNLYNDWLTRYSTVPKGRVILDGTGNAQNVPDVAADSRFSSCLFAVHDYSFFGSESMTKESDWENHIKGSVGNYADRTVCTEWGGPMSPGSKNGKSYDYLDYSKTPTNYFEAYIRGISNQLRTWKMGSFYWPGLRDGDWYSMTIKSGTGANIKLTIPNQSGLDRLQYAWTGPPPGADAGAGGTSGRDGAATGGAGGAAQDAAPGAGGAGGRAGSGGATASGAGGAGRGGGSGGASSQASGAGGTNAGTGGLAAGGGGGTRTSGTGGASATGGTSSGSGGSTTAAGGEAGSSQTTAGGGGSASLGSGGASSGGSAAAGTSGAPPAGGNQGCSCAVGRTPGSTCAWLLAFVAVAAVCRLRRRKSRG